jgi:hypothetical protein
MNLMIQFYICSSWLVIFYKKKKTYLLRNPNPKYTFG